MARATRLLKSFYRLLLPVAVFLVAAVMVGSILLVHSTSQPPKNAYLVTPEVFGRLSAHAAQITDETWSNRDGTKARGWLLRGRKDAPAVILLHKYGADRSHVLNLGVKLSEATDFTVLMPDQRGHGENPLVANTTFGGCEIEDTLSAIDYLRSLRDANKENLVGEEIGIYGVELGALAGIATAAKDQSIQVMVFDSVPTQSADLLDSVVERRYPFASFITTKMAEGGTYFYFASGCYGRKTVCEAASNISGRKVLLLSSTSVPALKSSTEKLAACFPTESDVSTFTDLGTSGFDAISASADKADSYDQKVIYYFQEHLKSRAQEYEESTEDLVNVAE